MTKFRQRTAGLAALVTLAVACVHVPDSIKQEFRAAEPDERSNYQPAMHGTAPPAEASDPWSRYHASLADAAAADAALPATDAAAAEDAAPAPAASSPVTIPNAGAL